MEKRVAATDAIPRRPFGKGGVHVSALGLGGHHLGEVKSVGEAIQLVHAAIDAGVTFFDNCWEYYNGRSEDWMGRALKGRRDKVFLMTKVCTHGRDAGLAMKMLDQSLRRLQTDHLDLWQVHGVSFDNDPALAYAKGGVLEALDRAKQQGKVRFVGFTGHKHPDVHLDMLQRGYPFDAVQMPLNPFDAGFRSFEQRSIARSQQAPHGPPRHEEHGRHRRRHPQGRSLGRRAAALRHEPAGGRDDCGHGLAADTPAKPAHRPRLQAADARRNGHAPQALRAKAADGRFEMYKVSLRYDNPEARRPHDFPLDPTQKELKEMFKGVTGGAK